MLKLSSIFTSQDGALFNSIDYEKQVAMYENGKSLFYIAAPGEKFENMSHEDAVVPVPLYKKGGKYSAAVGHNAKILSIPKTVKDPATTGRSSRRLPRRRSRNTTCIWIPRFPRSSREQPPST